MSDLAKLAKKIHPDWVKPPPKGKFGDYVPHYNITQLALLLGPYSFDVDREIYEDDRVVGVICTLRTVLDGTFVSITEAGDVDHGTHNGDRLKKAVSDAYKRCWMRLGLGLHLWAQDDYKLDQWLEGTQQV